MKKKNKWIISWKFFVLFFLYMIFAPGFALSEETYRFERMWPVLQQPWYFNQPRGVAIDTSGNVYVADTGNDRIQKFDQNGNYILKWGSYGTGDGQFDSPQGIAVDLDGNVYVADTGNDRIQKFDQDGQFIASIGEFGFDARQFLYPTGVCVNTEGLVYVSDRGNNRIQVFRQVNTPCVTLNDDLALHLCAEHMGIKYGFTMNYSQHPQHPSGFYWKMDLATLMQVSSDTQNCIQMGSDLKLNICTEYHGVKYTFTLDYFPDNIPDEHYWKIDLNTLEEIQ